MGNNKDAFLGMPHGTANNRLRKQLLFKYIRMAGEHYCFRCGAEIENVNDMSIEHIEPWENRNVDLFWDLENIAFSHLKCNIPHTRYGWSHKRKVGPEGTAWCSGHQDFLSVDRFYKNTSRPNGLRYSCKDCYDTARGRLRP